LTTDVSKIEEEAESVPGINNVRSLVERVDYVPAQPDDEEIEGLARAALDGGPLQVDGVTDGTVEISGESPSLLEQVAAFQHVLRIAGVRGIRSSVVPAPVLYAKETRERWLALKRRGEPMPGAFRDFWITNAVKFRLAANPEVPVQSVQVDTRNAVVRLFGVVATQEARANAEQEAEAMQLVERVENEIQVDPRIRIATSTAAAPKIEAELREALKNYAPLELTNVTVSVADGVVTLRGTAKREEYALAATLLARSIDGVRSVRNELTVPD
jgi:hyperosmotically inducible protein